MSNPVFIETEGSKQRRDTVYEGIKSGNPLLLEGETGTSKTRTAIEASKKNNQDPIIINFSSQTTIEDLIGRITKDEESYGCFSFTYGPYSKAFKNGGCLILDEINLAYENVLQCIQASLDSGKLYLETSGSEKEVIEKHRDFHLIATQNPLSGRFSQKRQYLSQKFRSRFQTIKFYEIEKEELLEIAEGLSEDLEIDNKKKILKKLIDFHFQWKDIANKEDQIHVFTIREISSTIKSMKEGLSPYESILINYGSRYDIKVLYKMKDNLLSLGFEKTKSNLTIPTFDDNLCYKTNQLLRSFSTALHLLQTCHPILITGPDGCGKTSFARWIAQIYQKNQLKKDKQEEDNNNEQSSGNDDQENQTKTTNVFICNPEVSISDIIGRYMPVMGATGEAPIMWIDGPVVKSLRNGQCLIMDQINTAPSTILERLNSLYDNFGAKDFKFSVQENSEEESVPVNPNFRIIATSALDGLGDISPALLNRFSIIYIDDQLVDFVKNKSKLTELIGHLSPPLSPKGLINSITESVFLNKSNMTMSKISKIVKGFYALKKALPKCNQKYILEFCLYATSNTTELPRFDESFIKMLLELLNDDDTKDSVFDTFIYNSADATRRIMAVLVASFIAGFHVILIGKTGLGKTSAAIALSRLCKLSQGRQLISFNGQTQLEELFGFFTIEKGNFTCHSGPLSDAMEKGLVFIADELNLADQMIIQSLNVAIEPSKNDEIILPIIGKNIVINERFFFIGCQNDISMYGRKPLPKSFKKKMLCINYPENSYNDLQSLIDSLANQFKLNIFDKNISKEIANMIELMKNDQTFKKKVWSLREVRKLFRRTKYTFSMNGFSLYTNAAFLLRSSFRDVDDISKKVVDLISKAFNLDNIKSEKLLKDIDADVKVDKVTNESKIILRKNSLSVTYVNSELLKIPEDLQTFWQTLFEVLLTHPSEPLLFVGPSGFKTFLAKIICRLSPVVYLHSDTTISSLIGQISLLDKNQARQYLLDSLYNLAGTDLTGDFEELFKEIKESEIVDKEKIENIKKLIANPSFANVANNIIQQLIDIDYSPSDSSSAFSNYLSVFKLGLVTKYILKQNALILKNIAQPSPTVLERLNELLSVTPTLTLFEDTSNTFTPPNEKILSNFVNFRIIGICHPSEKRGLSEAMLSRLTEISFPSYTTQDQAKVIDSILLQSKFNDDKSIQFFKNKLNTVYNILSKEKEQLLLSIPFTKIIEIVRIAISWRSLFIKNERQETEESLFSLALFRCATGSLPFNNKKLFIDTFYNETSGLSINDKLKEVLNEKTDEGIKPNDFLIIEEDQGLIRSTLSNIFIPSPLHKLPETNICFTPSLKDLIDVIISAASINYPLIIEGPNGTGKSSAFFYLSKCVDANVVRISISSSTTVEDLFGKYEPNTSSESLRFDFQPTNFLNAIKNKSSNNEIISDEFSPIKKQWIIIEELHLASASVLDSLAPVFNKQTYQLFLPDGTVVSKRDYFIVGLISQPLQNQSIIQTSMNYKTRDYTESEYKQIYKVILSNNNFNDEVCKYFTEKMLILSKLSSISQNKIPVTVREAYKFIKMFEGSQGQIEIEQLIKTLCLGRFANNEFFEEAKKELNYNDDNEKLPNISVEMGTSTLDSDGIPMHINLRSSKNYQLVQYLSSSEKELFVFLSMALKKYAPIVIQGPTSSGKTYSIQLFCDIVGKPLQIIQLNSEINSQTIAGTFQPSKNLSDSEMDELKEALLSISDLPNLTPEYSEKIKNDEIEKWKPSDFKNLRSHLLETKSQLDASDQENVSQFIKKINSLLQFYNHLERKDSVIIKAMIEGSWLLLDGIECAPTDFFDRLSTLFDDYPLLNLYERGNGYIYSYNSLNPERRIHPDFRLIMTYNPIDVGSNNIFPSSLLSRCTIFSMKAIDNSISDSSIIIYGLLNQIEIDDINPVELSIKLGKIQMVAKEFTFNSQFSVTGRTIIHLCHNILYKSNDDNFNIKDIIKINYCSLMDDTSKFMEAVDEKFEQNVDINMIKNIKKAENASKTCSEIKYLINNFISEVKTNIDTKFDFITFLSLMLQLNLKDVESVYNTISYKLLNFLSQMIMKNFEDPNKKTDKLIDFVAHCSSIRCLQILVNELREVCQKCMGNFSEKNITLTSTQVQEKVQIQIVVKKIKCFLYLIQKNIFVMQAFPILFDDDARKDFLKLLNSNNKYQYHKFLSNEYVYLFVDDKTDIESISKKIISNYMPTNLISNIQKLASCLFFNDKNFEPLFSGIDKLFFISLETLLNDNSDIEVFTNLIDYIEIFKDIDFDTSLSIDDFKSIYNEYSNSDLEEFNIYYQHLRFVNNKSPFQNHSNLPKGLKVLKPIIDTVRSLYESYIEIYNNLFLQRQKDKNAAKAFIKLIENINNRLEKEKELRLPLELFTKLTINIEITTENFDFLNQIYLSIKTEKDKEIDRFIWPHPSQFKFSSEIPPSYPLLDSLINYTKKEQIDLNSADWMTLCSIETNRECFLKEYLNKSISQELIIKYKAYLKAKLLYELSKIQDNDNEKYEYCSRNKIILFFNEISNRSTEINQTYVDLAHYYEMNMDKNFTICIPHFDFNDIVSLIINPIDKSPGPLFTDNLDSIIQQDIDFLKCIKISLNSKPDKNFFLMITKKYLALNKVTNIDDFSLDQMHDYVISKFSIENHIQVMVQTFYDAYQISKIALSNEKNIKLLFDDIPIKVDEEFIDKQPSPGFYLTLYHDIIPEIENIFNLEDESSFPITLFNYRIYTNQSIIELKLPSSFSSQDAEGLIIEISKIIKNNINNGKITKFSNLLGFLLDQVPISLNTNKSEHVREIILDLLSKIQNPIITKYIMKYLNKYIESMINILGSEKWIDLLKSDCFNIQNENQFLMFLMNPWKKVFDYIKNDFDNDKKQIDEKIRKIMDNINGYFSKCNNRGFFNSILDAKIKDEKHLQNIIKEEYQANSNIENEIDSNINKLVMNYSKYLNSALNQIKEFPSVYKDKFQSSDFYMDFYKHLTENSGFNHPIFDTEITLIVIITKDKTKPKVNIKFKKKNQDVVVSGLINTITIQKLPKNTSILDLNLSSIEADIYYFTVFTSTSTGLVKQFKFKEMISCFNDYKKQLDLVLENNQDFKIGNIEVCFNNHKFESFKDKINDIDKEIKEITRISGSLKIYSSSTQKILSKIKEIEDYFPLNFVNRTEILPKETNSSLEKFLNFISKSKQDLQEIEIPQEIIDADEEFIVNKSSSFQNILKISDRFAKKPRPIEGSTTKYTVDEFVRTCKNLDKLIIPTFFLTENDIVLNINHLSVKLGPFYKGTFYSDLKFRIINLTNNEIKCVFHQNDQIIDLKYENTDGFFYIVFPINQIKMDLNEDSEIKFTGKISFYSDNIEKPFKEIEYDITLLFLSTNIFIKLHKQSFAIKDGQAQIIPYFVTPRSNLSFTAIPYFRQIQLCELPDNTVKKPHFDTKDNDIKIKFPSLDENENNNYLSMQFDFGLTNDIPISIPLNVPISDPYFNVLIYDDKNKDFAENSTVSIGNLWRDVYVLISYINMTDLTVTPSISFEKMNSDVFEIRLNESIVFKPYSQDVRIMSFKARTIMLKKKKKNDKYTYNYTDNNNTDNYIDNSIEVRIGIENSKKVCFRLLLDKINYQQNNRKIRTNRYLKSCSFYDESNKFTDYLLKKNYKFKEINYIISPISYYVYIDQIRLYVKYNKGYLANYPKDFEYEILYISLISDKELTACTNINKDQCHQIEHQLRLFAKIKGYENSCFPLFGYRIDYVKEFDPSKTEQNTDNIQLFLEWCKQFFIDTKNPIPIYINNGVFYCNEYKLSNNIGYLIHCLTKNYKKLNYDGIIKSIQDFTNSKRIKEKYDSVVNNKTNIEWKLISLVWAIIDTIFYQYDNLTMRNFYLNLPISTETIIAEQERLIKKSKIDRSSMLITQEYSKILKKLDRISNDNKKYIDDYKNDGYSVSQFIKWTYEKNFETILEEEFPKEDTHDKDYKEDIEIEFSNDSGNFEIQNVSFNNAKSLIDIYNAFDSILKNTYQLTISIYSSFINKKNQKQNIDIFNELVSFFLWARDIQIYSPYSSFLNKFITAYQSMILRLQASGIKIRNYHYIKNEIFNKNNDFIEKPKIKKNIESLLWTRPGKQKMQVDDRKKKMKKKSYPHYTFNSIEQDDLLENDKNTVVTSFITEGKKNNSWSFRSEPCKKISTKTIHYNSKDSDEIPNQDYIDYIFNLMTNPSKVKEEIKLFNDDKSHIPMNYDIKIDSNDTEIVNNFIYAAENLSGSILNGLGMKSPVFNNIDNCYASILIDCSNIFSNIQKVSLILLTIAYGNALTALGIPYTIIIFCDDNFQFILKKLDDKHEKIHFLKLIESMTVKRRMSSITDAIQMAKLKIIPSGSYAKRTNHIIYTFSDGLSASLNSIKEWNSKILENKSVTVSFFFLNIISNEILIEIWSKFSTGISNAKSPTSVFYSTYDNILDNKEFFDVLSTPDDDDDEITKIISLSECFSRPIIQSIDQTEKEHSNIITPMLAKKLNSYDLDTNLLDSIIEILCEECSDERKYFKETSNENIFDESFDFEIPSIKIDSFSVNITFNDSKGQNSYSQFCNDLYSLSTKIIDQSSAQEMSSLIFIPNKPSQYTPSSDGTLFYFPGLIRFLLTQGQDTKIFLEKKAGFTKSYSIFVVVDCSTSCFNIQSTLHAFQSIFVLLQTLSKIDIPSFNLIITTKKGPLILCLEKSTFDALSINSPIWVTLFSFMLNPHEETLIESALLTTLSIRMQQKTLSSVLFLFTDGNFSLKKQKICNSILDNISSYNVETITIGIGSLPHISSLSTKKVWSANPKNVVKALLAAFGKETNELIPKISSLFINIPFDRMKLAENLEYNSIEQYTLKELITELNSITRNIPVFNDFYNIKSNGTEIISENSTHDLGIKNFYKGIKILICQFWDHTMSPNENENISKEVLINGVGNNKISVIKALYEFGITTLIVQNYYDAINEMKSGDYSEIWIICGRYDGKMPDYSDSANLLSQFIDALIMYWGNGGGIVFWADNSPFCAEVNFFLSKAKFDNDEKVKFRIGGTYPGSKMLCKSKRLDNATFTSKEQIQCDGYYKFLFNTNMETIYEGYTISSAIIPPRDSTNECYIETPKYRFASANDIKPFSAFSMSSSGGFSTLFYNSPLNSPKGDIVIDCGFSKLFFELTEENIYPYVKNIAIFMLSLEKKSSMIGGNADPRKVKPKKFDFNINKFVNPNPKYYSFNATQAVDIVFLIDGTGSMEYLINAVINVCNDLANKCKLYRSNNIFRFGAVIYRDEAVGEIFCRINNLKERKNLVEFSNLSEDIYKLQNFLSKIETRGGGNDGPEDWVSGFKRLKKLNWEPYSEKLVIHIANAGAHGASFNCGEFSYPYFTSDEDYNKSEYDKMDQRQDRELHELIEWAADKKIRFSCLCAGFSAKNSFEKAKRIYNEKKGPEYIYKMFNFDGENVDERQKREIFVVVKKMALDSIDKFIAVDKDKGNKVKLQPPSRISRTKKDDDDDFYKRYYQDFLID